MYFANKNTVALDRLECSVECFPENRMGYILLS